MITDELDGIHQRQERVLPDHPPLFLDEGHEEDHLSLQPQLLGMVRKLPGLAHQGGQGVRRPSLPYPPDPQVYSDSQIDVLPSGIINMSMASAACCLNHLYCCLLSRRPCLFS